MRSRLAPHERQHFLARMWRGQSFIVVLMIVLGMVMTSVVREMIRRVETLSEIEKLEGEVARLEHRNLVASQKLAYLSTSTFEEQEARKKLNLQKQGERVLILPSGNEERDIILPDSDKIRYIPVDNAESNPKKWIRFYREKFNL